MVFINRIFDIIITFVFSVLNLGQHKARKLFYLCFPISVQSRRVNERDPFTPCGSQAYLRLQEKFKYHSGLRSRYYEHFAAVDVFIAFIYYVGATPRRLIATHATA